MRIGLDMQAFQSVNGGGGIGKFCRTLVEQIFCASSSEDYFFLYYNKNYRDRGFSPENAKRTEIRDIKYKKNFDGNVKNADIQKKGYFSDNPDIVHVLSPFEDIDRTVIAQDFSPAKLVINLYDFIPYLYKDLYFKSESQFSKYTRRLEIMRSADLILSISEHTKRDAIERFGIRGEKIVTIGLAPSRKYFWIATAQNDLRAHVRLKYKIDKPFILSVSNLDPRKNILRLLKAYLSLGITVLKTMPLVIVTNTPEEHIRADAEVNALVGDCEWAVKFVYHATDEDLNLLYNACEFFVYASMYEGGGLPVLEAMTCGTAVIASNSSSIPEFVGRKDNLFDPGDVDDIARKMTLLIRKKEYRTELATAGRLFAERFNWETIATRTFQAYRQVISGTAHKG